MDAPGEQRPHPRDRRIRLGSDLRANSRRGPRADQAPHSRFARLRHLRRQSGMVPHPAGHARSARCDAHHVDLGHRAETSSPHAALVNGTQVQGFELDDVHRTAVLHVGAVTLPALIAVAESHAKLSGRDFLTAAVAGYEIGPRVGLVHGPGAYRPGLAFRRHRRRVLGRRRRGARRSRFPPTRPCTRSASPARNRPA